MACCWCDIFDREFLMLVIDDSAGLEFKLLLLQVFVVEDDQGLDEEWF